MRWDSRNLTRCFVFLSCRKKTVGESWILRQTKLAPAFWGAYKSKVCLSFLCYGNLSQPRAQGFVIMQQYIALILWTGLTLHVPELIAFCARLATASFCCIVQFEWYTCLFVAWSALRFPHLYTYMWELRVYSTDIYMSIMRNAFRCISTQQF